MFPLTVLNAIIYGLSFCAVYYVLVCLHLRRIFPLEFKQLFYYITIFSLFGVSGELLVNTVWDKIFASPLWQYHFLPAHGGYVSYFFLFIWGALGFYKYVNDSVIKRFDVNQDIVPGLIMGGEAIILEILYNGLFFVSFGTYIFYYLPDNLGPFSHLSCLQVLPFYFVVGYMTHKLVSRQNKVGYTSSVFVPIAFYWMVLAALFLG